MRMQFHWSEIFTPYFMHFSTIKYFYRQIFPLFKTYIILNVYVLLLISNSLETKVFST